MTLEGNFNIESLFSTLNFNSIRLVKRFFMTMKLFLQNTEETIRGACVSTKQLKAIYRMCNNEKFKRENILQAHNYSISKLITENYNKVLLIQDTTSINYNSQKKKEGNGFISAHIKGVNLHTCIAVSTDGLVLGVMDQIAYNRESSSDDSQSKHEKKKRAIKDKESNRWLVATDNSHINLPKDFDTVTITDREGDIYEFINKMTLDSKGYLIRVSQNRMTTDNKRIINAIKATDCKGTVQVQVPRDTKNNIKERIATLDVYYDCYSLKRPATLNKTQNILPSIDVSVIYLKENNPDDPTEGIEWVLMTNAPVNSLEEAMEQVQYYQFRWRIERFHYALKQGCKVEKIQSRRMEVTIKLLLMYSIIAIIIMNLTYLARINPDLPCTLFFDEDEWKFLYGVATEKDDIPDEPYTIFEAVEYISWLGGPKTPDSYGPPGIKTIWKGIRHFYTLYNKRKIIAKIVGQV